MMTCPDCEAVNRKECHLCCDTRLVSPETIRERASKGDVYTIWCPCCGEKFWDVSAYIDGDYKGECIKCKRSFYYFASTTTTYKSYCNDSPSDAVSIHFRRHEFACKCKCGFDAADTELVIVLEDVRVRFKAPVTINSACRCPAHNRDEGGEEDSQHLLAKAGDIEVKGVHPSRVADYLESKYTGRYGIGRYSSFTHIDVRPTMARWG